MNPVPDLERPSLADIFGPNAATTTASMKCDQIRVMDSLALVDRALLCQELPKSARKEAELHARVLSEVQAKAGDDTALRELLVEVRVATRYGAAKLCRRLINQARGG